MVVVSLVVSEFNFLDPSWEREPTTLNLSVGEGQKQIP